MNQKYCTLRILNWNVCDNIMIHVSFKNLLNKMLLEWHGFWSRNFKFLKTEQVCNFVLSISILLMLLNAALLCILDELDIIRSKWNNCTEMYSN